MTDTNTILTPCPSDLKDAVSYFTERAFETIPLVPGSKRAIVGGWHIRPTREMWETAPPQSNIGIRAGGPSRLAILDFDDKNSPGTTDRGLAWLQGMGLKLGDYPLVQTASGVGHHAYVRLTSTLVGNAARFDKRFAAGELRFGPGAYVVAPPSIVSDRPYLLQDGSFDRLPSLSADDLLTLTDRSNSQASKYGLPRIDPLPRLSGHVRELIDGGSAERYESRSEAEQAIVVGLIRVGLRFDSILAVFDQYPCAGRYTAERSRSHQHAAQWLRHGYDNGVRYLMERGELGRREAERAADWAHRRAWPGRAGQSHKMVFLAHAVLAGRAGRGQYGASARELAELTGFTAETCAQATRRLQRLGLVEVVSPSHDRVSTVYRLVSQTWTIGHSGEGE